MTGRERLMATLQGRPVDRPAVSFYEIGGFDVSPADPDPLNVYNDPSWLPLLTLAEEHTDLIRMRSPAATPATPETMAQFLTTSTYFQEGSRYTRTTLRVGGREMTALARRSPDMDTEWTLEHLLKDTDDLKAYLTLPDEVFSRAPDVANLKAEDARVGDRGIVMVDTLDPLCMAAALFSMENYTIVALTEQRLFHRLLEKLAPPIQAFTEATAKAFPGHLWRIYGPEYATEPYLPPSLFEEYVGSYTGPMIRSIQQYGGYARIHCHGRLRSALPILMKMAPDAIDPVEPPPQGDITLADVRAQYGKNLVLFGNIEISDIENVPPPQFERIVRDSLVSGTQGEGRGFVLMPTACPCGREISAHTLANYKTMVLLATASTDPR